MLAQANEQNHRKLDGKLDTLISTVTEHRVESAEKWAELSQTRDDVRKLKATVAQHEKWKNRLWWLGGITALLPVAAVEWVKAHFGGNR